jgi:hypothetical protein
MEGGGLLVFGVLVLEILVLAGVLVLTRYFYGAAWRLEVVMVEPNVWQLVEVVVL